MHAASRFWQSLGELKALISVEFRNDGMRVQPKFSSIEFDAACCLIVVNAVCILGYN